MTESVGRDELPSDELARILDRFGDWVRFADAKAGGVLVLQALGLADLIRNASRLADAHKVDGRWGDIGTGSFWVALVLAGVVVVLVSAALFPRVKPARNSLYFFGSVAKEVDGKSYGRAFASMSQRDRYDALAEQVWELARIASTKYYRTRWAYGVALGFLIAWSTARVALALSA